MYGDATTLLGAEATIDTQDSEESRKDEITDRIAEHAGADYIRIL